MHPSNSQTDASSSDKSSQDASVQMKNLVTKQGHLKSRLTKFKTFIESFNEITDNVIQIELRLTKVQQVWSDVENVQYQIELLDSPENQENERDSFETNYFDVITAAQVLIDRMKVSLSCNSRSSSRASSPHQASSNHNHNRYLPPEVGLPVLSLPSFNGLYDAWPSFYQLFTSLIHNNHTLSIIMKFQYLRSCTIGEASAIIDSISLTDENYTVAWSLLVDRFQNKNLIIRRHIRELCNLRKIEKNTPSLLNSFVTDILKHTRSLKVLGQPIEHWDSLLIHVLSVKLDTYTYKEWQIKCTECKENLPSMADFMLFLRNQCHILEAMVSDVPLNLKHFNSNKSLSSSKVAGQTNQTQSKPSNVQSRTALVASTDDTKSRPTATLNSQQTQPKTEYTYHPTTACLPCPMCKEQHQIFICSKFFALSIHERFTRVQKLRLCLNCLRSGHEAKLCRSKRCKICGYLHNTLLHRSKEESNQTSPQTNNQTTTQHSNQTLSQPSIQTSSQLKNQTSSQRALSHAVKVATNSLMSSTQTPHHVLMSTALVQLEDSHGNSVQARALLDSGSQCSFVSRSLCQRLHLDHTSSVVPITGIGTAQTRASSTVNVTIKSHHSDYSEKTNFIVLFHITHNIPSVQVDISKWKFPPQMILADPAFNVPSNIDVLLRADLFWNILGNDDVTLQDNNIQLRDSRLGWIVVGATTHASQEQICCLTTLEKIHSQVKKFWELEDVNSNSISSNEEKMCESHYINTTSRASNGKYIVQLPFKMDPAQLGDSRETAQKRFLALERRLKNNSNLHSQYVQFMREYHTLGHMVELTSQEIISLPSNSYFLSHHPVFKDSSSSTKMRVVFDASSKTTSGLSLNDILHAGPVVQNDLFHITTSARLHNVIICADIEKMYRQILIHPSHSHFLLILWRENPENEIKIYKLVTVTYGTTCAAYQATRTLNQLALDEQEDYYLASQVIQQVFYVDDLMTGCKTHEEAIQVYKDLSSIMKRGGFNLRKWNSNSSQFLNVVESDERAEQSTVTFDNDVKHKTLGLVWDPRHDTFCFFFNDSTTCFTKRSILSIIARIFDPLGLIGALISKAKIFMQRLWVQSLNWDEEVAEPLLSDWKKFYDSLILLSQLEVPRQICTTHSKYMEIHGFSDASEKVFGACVYLRSIDHSGQVTVRLISSKSRVAPLKSQSIPRLELCGALLLATLVQHIQESLKGSYNAYYWTDSTITLNWIAASPSRWTTFVRNRVAKVQELTSIASWRHINGKDNPADLISRGIDGTMLLEFQMWWKGQTWLSESNEFWNAPITATVLEDSLIPEKSAESILSMHTQINHPLYDLINRYSFIKVIHITAYCLRFCHNALSAYNSSTQLIGPLSPMEIDKSQLVLISFVQGQSFCQELKDLIKQRQVSKDSNLIALSPFLDSSGLIRVGGRLQNSHLTSDQKHSIVLPNHNRFVEELIRYEHHRLLHAGPQGLLNAIRQQYWPLDGRNQVRKIIRSCIQCYKAKPSIASQHMGQLPKARVTPPSRPFVQTGVDYCGPVLVKMSNRRGSSPNKAYIALFVCFATKAIHLELVEDLTSKSFISALRWFISRRGKPSHLYSDNGTNFVGAQKELIKIHHLSNSSDKVQVETFSSGKDPSDLLPLTPAHLLIYDTFNSLPEPNLKLVKENRLDKWGRTQQLNQHFWSRWSKDYLNELQQKTKWKFVKENVQLDSLALIKEDNTPPMVWRLERVVQVHPDSDGKVRVVTLKTKSGLIQRPISKICPLPTTDEEDLPNDVKSMDVTSST